MIDIDKIIALESGELTEAEYVRTMAALIESGAVWHLQGCYGRAAAALIDAGVVAPDGTVLVDRFGEPLDEDDTMPCGCASGSCYCDGDDAPYPGE